MLAAKMGVLFVFELLFDLCAKIPRQGAEHGPGRFVAGGDGGLQALDLGAGIAGEDVANHALAQAKAAGISMDCHLPDKQGVGFLRDKIARNETGKLAVELRCHRGVCEVVALQEVAVNGVGVEWRAGSDELVKWVTVGFSWFAKLGEGVVG